MSAYPDPKELFSGIPADRPIVVAVSGGSDSIALLHLAASWAISSGAELHVVTVDHGLRPEAAAEAAFVSGTSEGLNLEHYTLAWEGIKPVSGVSEQARSARYHLIEEFAQDLGVSHILLGHTMDDQAETIWMRNSRNGSNPQYRGLAGMARHVSLGSGAVICRPLLGCRREQLRFYLASIGQAWIEDPSNFDHSYERVRARQRLPKAGIAVESLARFAALNGRLRQLRSKSAETLLKKELGIFDGPVFTLNHQHLASQEAGLSALCLQMIIAIAGGREQFVSTDLAGQCLKLDSGNRLTAGGCVVEQNRGELVFYRENRNLSVIRLEPGEQRIWDGRLLLANHSDASFFCRSLTSAELLLLESERGERLPVSPRAALQSMPVVMDNKGRRYMPFLRGKKNDDMLVWRLIAPAIDHFCSEHDSALFDLVNHIRAAFGIGSLHEFG